MLCDRGRQVVLRPKLEGGKSAPASDARQLVAIGVESQLMKQKLRILTQDGGRAIFKCNDYKAMVLAGEF